MSYFSHQVTGSFTASQGATTSGGATPFHYVSASGTNATSVKAAPGQIYSLAAMNSNTAPRFLKLYNKASAPVVGTDTPVHTYMIPGNSAGAGFTLAIPPGQVYALGIAFAITGAMPDNDTTSINANEVVVDMDFA